LPNLAATVQTQELIRIKRLLLYRRAESRSTTSQKGFAAEIAPSNTNHLQVMSVTLANLQTFASVASVSLFLVA
jgi:hypothetical protein